MWFDNRALGRVSCVWRGRLTDVSITPGTLWYASSMPLLVYK
jgi:hypothetical protein